MGSPCETHWKCIEFHRTDIGILCKSSEIHGTSNRHQWISIRKSNRNPSEIHRASLEFHWLSIGNRRKSIEIFWQHEDDETIFLSKGILEPGETWRNMVSVGHTFYLRDTISNDLLDIVTVPKSGVNEILYYSDDDEAEDEKTCDDDDLNHQQQNQ